MKKLSPYIFCLSAILSSSGFALGNQADGAASVSLIEALRAARVGRVVITTGDSNPANRINQGALSLAALKDMAVISREAEAKLQVQSQKVYIRGGLDGNHSSPIMCSEDSGCLAQQFMKIATSYPHRILNVRSRGLLNIAGADYDFYQVVVIQVAPNQVFVLDPIGLGSTNLVSLTDWIQRIGDLPNAEFSLL